MFLAERLRARSGLFVGAVVLMGLPLAACSGASPAPNGGVQSSAAPATATWWVRAANEAKSKNLVQLYNASHPDQVKLAVFPDDQFVTKVGTATSSGDVPDILAADSVYMPQFIDSGVFTDITGRVDGLTFKDKLFPQLMTASSKDGAVYAVPRDPGTSLLFWNKALFKKAGLDPERAPASWDEVRADAAKVQKLGGKVSGYYLAGACAGCNAYTYLPMVWAAGGDLLDSAGGPTFTDQKNIAALEALHGMWSDASIPQGAKSDSGANWLTGFTAGQVGIQPLGSFAIAALKDSGVDYGVSALPGDAAGPGASFIGGDVIGIPAKAKQPDAAWRFIEWTLSEDVQLNQVAKAGELVSRTDLVDNELSKADPRVLVANQSLAVGRVPVSKYYQQLIQDPNGPFLLMLQQAIFNGDATKAANEAQTTGEGIVGR